MVFGVVQEMIEIKKQTFWSQWAPIWMQMYAAHFSMTVKAEMFCFVIDVSDQEQSLGVVEDSQLERERKKKNGWVLLRLS